MPAFMAAYIIVFYWFDKWMYLRYSTKPANTDDRTIGYFVELLQYGFWWHAVAGTAVFSNQNIFSSRVYFKGWIGKLNEITRAWGGGAMLVSDRYG
jgi:hypothetical protein